MIKRVMLLLLALSIVSCASRSRMKAYESDLNEIKDEVHNIRVITDQMRDQLGTMSHTIVKMSDEVEAQAGEIEEQKENHDRLKTMMNKLTGSVEGLEVGTLPQKEAELKEMSEADKMGVNVKAVQDGKVTTIITEERASDAVVTKQKNRPVKDTDSGFGYAVKDGVILWQHPSTSSDVLEILVSWQQLALLEKVKKRGTWWKVRTKEYVGYVNARYIIVSE